MKETLLVVVIVTALAFDFTNGFHDTANAVATSISTRAMPPRIAVAFSAILNFVGAFISLKVATTIAGGIVSTRGHHHDSGVRGAARGDRVEPGHVVATGCPRVRRTR